MFYLTSSLFFPPVSEANYNGILAIGGDLLPERLLLAYKAGFFGLNRGAYYFGGQILEWFVFLDELIVSKSMRNIQ
jgi:leucyl/phenylalanyl-tRNA--protein transferase